MKYLKIYGLIIVKFAIGSESSEHQGHTGNIKSGAMIKNHTKNNVEDVYPIRYSLFSFTFSSKNLSAIHDRLYVWLNDNIQYFSSFLAANSLAISRRTVQMNCMKYIVRGINNDTEDYKRKGPR